MFGDPEGVNGVGLAFFGDFLLRLTKSYPPSEGGIKLAAPGANTVNSISYLHSHAVRGNEKLLLM